MDISEKPSTSTVGHVAKSVTEEAEKTNHPDGSDNSVGSITTIESYIWWAARSREFEKNMPGDSLYTQLVGLVKGKKSHQDPTSQNADSPSRELSDADHSQTSAVQEDRYGVTEAEWEQAQRAVRTATWGSMFYLITTDILGPWGVPWSLAVSE